MLRERWTAPLAVQAACVARQKYALEAAAAGLQRGKKSTTKYVVTGQAIADVSEVLEYNALGLKLHQVF